MGSERLARETVKKTCVKHIGIRAVLDSHTKTRGVPSAPLQPNGATILCRSGPVATLIWESHRTPMPPKLDVKQGTLALMILTTLDVLGPLHGYGIARRIEETSRNRLTLNYGTLYPALVKLEQQGFVKAEWRQSENNRRAKYYALTTAGRKQLARETREWHQTTDLIAAFLAPRREES